MRRQTILTLVAFLAWHLIAICQEPAERLNRQVEATHLDTLAIDSVSQDSVPIDTLPTNTLSTDTLPVDTAGNVRSVQERKITPVDVDDNKPFKPSLHYYDTKGELLEQPVMFLSELDTLKKNNKVKMQYPTVNALSVGLNVWDPIMTLTGQKYGGIDLWADLSIYNRIFPVVEVGVGMANSTPKDANYTYKCHPSIYAKIGVNYNFFFNDTDDYQFFAGIRGGFSSFGYEIQDITVNSSYWGESHNFAITDQHSTALYGEALLGIKVKIWKAFSMGWSFRYHHLFKCKDASNSSPYYIPGFGNRNSKLGASFSLIYTIDFADKNSPDESR